MSRQNDDRFRVRPDAPKHRGDPYINKVLRETSKAGAKAGKTGRRPGARLGRGHVAARFAGRSLTANARRVTIKTRLVNLAQAGPRSITTHLRYIEREGVDRKGGSGRAYGATTDDADLESFKERSAEDRHQFRFIVSPEDAAQIDDLRTYTRHLMARMEADLGTRLEWVAVDHWNTDNPHTHVVLRGQDDAGKDLIISRDYIAEGMRWRASELATEWLGPRTQLEIQHAMRREVDQERWTGLDRTLQRETGDDGLLRVERFAGPPLARQRQVLIGRLQRLQRMGLATERQTGVWALHAGAETSLRAMGERGDIIRTMQRAMSGQQRELAVFQASGEGRGIVGRVVGKGLADELRDKGYLVIDGIDGRAHYVELPPRAELEQYPTGAVVEVRGSVDVRTADRNIAVLAVNGIYRTDHHLTLAQGQAAPGRDPRELVTAHVRRLEALRLAGIVERMDKGVWRVPGDLTEKGRQYDAQRLGGVAVELKSHLPIERQARIIGATWLDQQLIGGGKGIGDVGFGGEVKDALRRRTDFLVEQGLVEKRGRRVILACNLLATLRGREVAKAAQDIAAETGLEHRPVSDGLRVAGIYRCSVTLTSGRYVMLDDGKAFSLVPWKPVINKRIGQQLAATVRGGGVSWDVGWQRGPGVA